MLNSTLVPLLLCVKPVTPKTAGSHVAWVAWTHATFLG